MRARVRTAIEHCQSAFRWFIGILYYLRAVKHYQWTAFLSISSEHSKPYMILKALCKGFQEIYRFAMLRSRGKEWQLREVTL